MTPPRPITATDLPALKAVIDGAELFPSDMLDDMIAPYLDGQGDDIWLTQDDGGEPASIAYCAPEMMTEGTMNLYLIATATRGRGHGTALLHDLENRLRARNARILLVETSGTPAYEPAGKFYDARGFTREARIRDFYAAGDDKIVFRKALT